MKCSRLDLIHLIFRFVDWEYVHVVDGPASGIVHRIKHNPLLMSLVERLWSKASISNIKYTIKRLKIERSMNFMAAHAEAQQYVLKEFENAASELSEAARIVINESKEQWQLAEAVLHTYKREDVESITSHKFCAILLNAGQHYITKLVKRGMLKDDEAEHWVKEIEGHLEHTYACTEEAHPGEVQVDFIADETCEGKLRDDDSNIEDANGKVGTAEGTEVTPDDVQEMFKDVGEKGEY